MSNDVKLARFGHHPDPAIDFCIEVESIESIMADKALGLRANEPWPAERVAKAMTFRVCADENCVVAKAALRKVEASLNQRHQPHREAVLEEVVRTFAEGLWAEARKRGEMRPEFMPSSRTDFLDEARKQLTALKATPAPAVKPHCSTCGKDVAEVLCETCGKWWADNPPPAPAEPTPVGDVVSTDEQIKRAAWIIQNWRDGNAGEDTAEDTARFVLSRLRGEV